MKHYGKENPYIGKEDAMQKASNHLMSAKFPDLYASAFHVPNGEMLRRS